MSLDSMTRKKAFIVVTVDNHPRRFTLRAHSVVQHLELLELRETARKQALLEVAGRTESQAGVARADMAATLAAVTYLLQDPADGGQGLLDEESWLLGLDDPFRVLELQYALTNVDGALGRGKKGQTAPGMAKIIDEWLDVGTTIARAGLAPEPHTPLNEWSMGQVVETYHRACRELWRDMDLKVRLAGGKGSKEPDFRSPRAKAASKAGGGKRRLAESVSAFIKEQGARG